MILLGVNKHTLGGGSEVSAIGAVRPDVQRVGGAIMMYP